MQHAGHASILFFNHHTHPDARPVEQKSLPGIFQQRPLAQPERLEVGIVDCRRCSSQCRSLRLRAPCSSARAGAFAWRRIQPGGRRQVQASSGSPSFPRQVFKIFSSRRVSIIVCNCPASSTVDADVGRRSGHRYPPASDLSNCYFAFGSRRHECCHCLSVAAAHHKNGVGLMDQFHRQRPRAMFGQIDFPKSFSASTACGRGVLPGHR